MHARPRTLPARLVALGLVLGLPVLVAWAHWSVVGAGSGLGGSATVQDLVVTPATPSSLVLPGAHASLAVAVANPNTVEVRLESLVLDTTRGAQGFAVDAAHAGCGLEALSLTAQSNGGAGWTIPAGGSRTLQLADALVMTVDAADACQGATFTAYLRAGP